MAVLHKFYPVHSIHIYITQYPWEKKEVQLFTFAWYLLKLTQCLLLLVKLLITPCQLYPLLAVNPFVTRFLQISLVICYLLHISLAICWKFLELLVKNSLITRSLLHKSLLAKQLLLFIANNDSLFITRSKICSLHVEKITGQVSKYGVFSGPYFPVFGLNTEIYGVNLHIKSDTEEYGPEKICIWTLFTQ